MGAVVGQTPCDGCRYRPRCEAELLGCQALIIFKRVSSRPKRWSQAPRCAPSHDLYLQAQLSVESMQSVRRRERAIPDLSQLQAELEATFRVEE
jgi:hypothetical protein